LATNYNINLGLKVVFSDEDAMGQVLTREEWIPLAEVPLNVKIGNNPAIHEQMRLDAWRSIPIYKRLFLKRAKVYADFDDEKQAQKKSWMDKMRGRKELGVKTYYSLFLPEKESGADVVKGNIGVRLMFHTRGLAMRGIDEVVTRMSLGEKALVNVRSDYGFGEAYGDFNLPPHSDLTVELDLVAVAGRGALFLFFSR